MTRPLRIPIQGGFYHVVNRGNNRMNIFFGDEDMELFLAVLEESQKLHSVNILSFCLMQNHYHILIHTPNANLSAFMRQVNGLFTQRMNKVHKRDGHLFKGRYKAVLVQEERYLANAIRYIHMNPVKAGIVRDPADWIYSSHRILMGKRGLEWLDHDRALRVFGATLDESRENYRVFMAEGIDGPTDRFYSQKKLSAIFGESEFKHRTLQSRLLSDRPLKVEEVTDLRKTDQSLISETILRNVCLAFQTTPHDLRTTERGKTNLARLMAVGLLREKAGLSHSGIQSLLGIQSYKTSSTSHHRLRQVIKTRAHIKNLYEALSLSCSQGET